MGEPVLIPSGYLLSSDEHPFSGMCSPRNRGMDSTHTHVVQVGCGLRGLPGPRVLEGRDGEPAFWTCSSVTQQWGRSLHPNFAKHSHA